MLKSKGKRKKCVHCLGTGYKVLANGNHGRCRYCAGSGLNLDNVNGGDIE